MLPQVALDVLVIKAVVFDFTVMEHQKLFFLMLPIFYHNPSQTLLGVNKLLDPDNNSAPYQKGLLLELTIIIMIIIISGLMTAAWHRLRQYLPLRLRLTMKPSLFLAIK